VTYDRIRDFEVTVRSRTTCNMSRLWRLRLKYILFINLFLTLILSVKKPNNTEENPFLLRETYTSQKRNPWVQFRLSEC
jgi:hypothetical protein